MSGRLRGVGAELAHVLADARRLAVPETSALAGAVEARWRVVNGDPTPPLNPYPHEQRARPDLRRFLRFERAYLDVRHGRPVALEDVTVEALGHPGLRAQAEMIRAIRAVLGGRLDGAMAHARAGVTVAADAGHWVRLGECLHTQCEVLVIARAFGELSDAATGLRALGARLDADRVGNLASFFEAVARNEVTLDRLEAWAARDDVVPTLARRARALLDRHAPLDAVDQALVAVVRERMGAAQDDDDT